MSADTVLVRVSRVLLEEIATRDEAGNRLHVEWGRPIDAVDPTDIGLPIYEPTITVDYSDNPCASRETVR